MDTTALANLANKRKQSDCPYCHGDKSLAKIAIRMGFRPDVSFSKVRELEQKIEEIMYIVTDVKNTKRNTHERQMQILSEIRKIVKS